MPRRSTVPATYQPFLAVHGDGTDPWFVLWANELIVMNKQNRQRMQVMSKMLDMGTILALVALAGVASGLTLAMFTLDPEKIKSSAMSGRGRRSEQARRVLPHLTNAHWTLVTLLILNAIAVETMPLVLSRLYGGIIAVMLSVVLVLFFGEIIPQALFTRYALPVCSFFSPFISFAKFATCPLSWPVAKLLDLIIGKREKKFLRRVELQQLIRLHQTEEKARRHEERDAALIEATYLTATPAIAASSAAAEGREMLPPLAAASTPGMSAANMSFGRNPNGATANAQRQLGKQRRRNVKPGPRAQRATHKHDDDESSSSSSSSDSDHLEEMEVRIMIGALTMSELTVKQIVTKTVDKIFCVAADRKIDKEVVERVFVSGFSRVLVLDEDTMHFIGYFLSRDLVAFAYKSEADAPLARNLTLHQPIYCSGKETIGMLYTKLCLVTTPIVIVTDAPASNIDVSTLSGPNIDAAVEVAAGSSEAAKKYKPVGLVTFEDVFETVQGTLISDETDADNEKAIQLKSKLFAAMTMRRQNQRMTEVLTNGMLRRELTDDRFAVVAGWGANTTPLVSASAGPQPGDDSATARTGLLARTGSFQNLSFGGYGATGNTRSSGALPPLAARSPYPLPRGRYDSRGDVAEGSGSTTVGNNTGLPVPAAPSDTFLSPRMLASARFTSPSRGSTPQRRSQ